MNAGMLTHLCVGIAKSKTLAKIANKTATYIKELAGCVWDRVLAQTTEKVTAPYPGSLAVGVYGTLLLLGNMKIVCKPSQ